MDSAYFCFGEYDVILIVEAGWRRIRLLKSAISRRETPGGEDRCTIKVRCREPRRHQRSDVFASPRVVHERGHAAVLNRVSS